MNKICCLITYVIFRKDDSYISNIIFIMYVTTANYNFHVEWFINFYNFYYLLLYIEQNFRNINNTYAYKLCGGVDGLISIFCLRIDIGISVFLDDNPASHNGRRGEIVKTFLLKGYVYTGGKRDEHLVWRL